MKLKAKLKKGVIKAKVMFKHDMTTYDQAAKKFGDRNKANFITHITATVNGETIYEASTSQFLSKNPIIKFQAKGDKFKKGDKIIVSYTQKIGKDVSKKSKLK